jgi:hypothetical protein
MDQFEIHNDQNRGINLKSSGAPIDRVLHLGWHLLMQVMLQKS